MNRACRSSSSSPPRAGVRQVSCCSPKIRISGGLSKSVAQRKAPGVAAAKYDGLKALCDLESARSGRQNPVQHSAPVDHADRRPMIAILEEREMRRVFCLVELLVQRLLVGGGIDRVAASMGKPERQLGL